MVILSAQDVLEKLTQLKKEDPNFNIRKINVDIGNSNTDLEVIGIEFNINKNTITIQTID